MLLQRSTGALQEEILDPRPSTVVVASTVERPAGASLIASAVGVEGMGFRGWVKACLGCIHDLHGEPTSECLLPATPVTSNLNPINPKP